LDITTITKYSLSMDKEDLIKFWSHPHRSWDPKT